MVDSKTDQKISQLILFRRNMGAPMPKEKIAFFWKKELKNLGDFEKKEKVKLRKKKANIVKKNIDTILFFNWVKFVGITGSVAAGVPKKEDDIDVFIVVKNNRMWLYRAFLTLKLGRKSLRRVWGQPFKDKIDTNFICEERGLWFNTESIFVLHELLFMVPVYNKDYYENILNINHQLLENYDIERKKEEVNRKTNIFFKVLDTSAFIVQYIYMFLRKHKPDYKRLVRNNKKGRIEFFPKDFRKKKVEEFEKSSNQV